MTDSTKNSEDSLRKLSRRNMLRDSAITATGVVLLPSFLTGCTKEAWEYIHEHRGHGGGLGGVLPEPPPTLEELQKAAKNLDNMRSWLLELHGDETDYEIDMLELIKSGNTPPSGWGDFILHILLDILEGVITAAAAAAATVSGGVAGAAAIAVLAVTSELAEKFYFSENRPHGLDGVFAEFKTGQDRLYEAIRDALHILADEADTYKNLRDKWTQEFDFNDKKYTYRDLATADFPADSNGTVFVATRKAAFDQFRKYFWNVMFIKAGTMTYSAAWSIYADGIDRNPTYMARAVHYSDPRYKSTYLRGFYEGFGNRYYYRYWYWAFDGRELSADAAKELFKDDTPEDIINPDGLFLRSYVFKQFHTEKPDFFGYHELRKDLGWDLSNRGFDVPDDYVFTGGEFPQLTRP